LWNALYYAKSFFPAGVMQKNEKLIAAMTPYLTIFPQIALYNASTFIKT
jgi:hypothetical protein